MKHFFMIMLFFSSVILLSFSLGLFSCGDDDDDSDDDDDEDGDDCDLYGDCCDPYEQDACESLEGCQEDYDFGYTWETTKECKEDIIQPLLDSDDPCEQAAGQCLNTLEKYGYGETGEAGLCELIEPKDCEEGWQLWTECLEYLSQENCE